MPEMDICGILGCDREAKEAIFVAFVHDTYGVPVEQAVEVCELHRSIITITAQPGEWSVRRDVGA